MSVFLTPDGRPFYGGTYSPKTRRYGMPAFMEVLQAMALEFLPRVCTQTRDELVLKTVTLALNKMARGGMYDQLGGGIHRYTGWNGLMLTAFAAAARVPRREDYRKVAERNAAFLLAKVRGGEGQLKRSFKDGQARLNGYLVIVARARGLAMRPRFAPTKARRGRPSKNSDKRFRLRLR